MDLDDLTVPELVLDTKTFHKKHPLYHADEFKLINLSSQTPQATFEGIEAIEAPMPDITQSLTIMSLCALLALAIFYFIELIKMVKKLP